MGEKVAEQLVESGLVTDLPDLYDLTEHDLIQLEKFAEKSANNLLTEIEQSKNVDLISFITALGIRHVGTETARLLADHYTLDELLDMGSKELEQIDEIGPEIAKSISGFFQDAGGELVRALRKKGVEPKSRETGDELDGLKIVITGALEDYTRREITELLQDHSADGKTILENSLAQYVHPNLQKLGDSRKYSIIA